MKGWQRALAAAGGIFGLYGLGVLTIIGFSHWFDAAGVLAGAGLLLLALLGPRILSLRKPIPLIASLVLILALAGFSLAEGAILRAALQKPSPGADYVIVLGAKVQGTVPSLTLSRRIRGAAEYLSANPDSVAVATGGQGPGEALPEAAAIAASLETLGIPRERILVEPDSSTTRENLLFGLALIEKAGGSRRDPVVIVSSGFHLYRAQKLAAGIGYTAVSGKGCPSMAYLEPHYFLREAAALLKEKLEGNL